MMSQAVRITGVPSSGRGSVRVRNRKWQGRIYTTPDVGSGVKEVSVYLGKAEEMTKEQAQEKLREMIVPRHLITRPKLDRISKQFEENAVTIQEAILDEGNWEPESKRKDNRRNMRRGVWAEMRAASDLLMKGFEVFKPYNPLCEFDLLVLDGTNPLRVEVKLVDESAKRPFCEIRRNLGNFDVLACVFRDGAIIYKRRTVISELAGKNKRLYVERSERLPRTETGSGSSPDALGAYK